ncbi:hypothetical protein Ahy_A06g028478 [Arachis hypogaea]|uniref:Uncharacterized protein n=1 Tax=Arachis hypogaea TaxID=3818 RepID=A0A445CR97_ARAHY|nr:hypothetical protein Ahy_A06g028478 [Arachis hypogaea]
MFPLKRILTPFLSLKTGISRSRSKNTHAPYKPNEVFDDFLDEQWELLDKQAEEPVVEKDKKEIAFLEGLRINLQNNGPNTILIIFNPTSTSNR